MSLKASNAHFNVFIIIPEYLHYTRKGYFFAWIMMKIKKAFSLKIALMIVSVIVLFTSTIYSHPCIKESLRLQVGPGDDTYERVLDVRDAQQALIEERQILDLYDKKVPIEIHANHVMRVTRISIIIAKEMGLSKISIRKLRRAALLHDIGRNGMDYDAFFAIRRLGEDYGINTRRRGLATTQQAIERVENDINSRLSAGDIQEKDLEDLVERVSEGGVRLRDHIRENLYILVDHEERGIEIIGTLGAKIVFPVTDDIATIIRHHIYPDKLPQDTDEEIRLLTGILVAADYLETLNNKGKFEIEDHEKWKRLSLFDDAEHYGTLSWMERTIDIGRLTRELYLVVERLIYEQNPDLLELILEARQADALLPDEIEHIKAARTHL